MSKKHHKREDGLTEEETRDLPADSEPEISVSKAEETAQPAAAQPDYYDKYVRLCAEYDNFRKRTEREKAALFAYGKKEFAEKLLPAYEVLLRQRDKMQTQQSGKECAAELKNLLDGIKMVLGELDKAFKAEGVEKMDTIGKPYDPMTQEAIAALPAKAEQDGLVLEEVQMGFTMDGKTLRPARVVVGKAGEEA